MSYLLDLERAGVPSFDMGACRRSDYDSETLDFHHLDLTGATLEYYISDQPGGDRLATFVTSKQTETQPYQAYIDECRFEADWIPCGETASDMMTSSTVHVTSARSSLDLLPRAAEAGAPVELYYTLRQTAPTQEVLLAGRFILTETA